MRNQPTLEEWIEKYSAVQVLEKNLRINLDVLTEFTEEEKDQMMRVNMIMIRQCLQDFGAE